MNRLCLKTSWPPGKYRKPGFLAEGLRGCPPLGSAQTHTFSCGLGDKSLPTVENVGAGHPLTRVEWVGKRHLIKCFNG